MTTESLANVLAKLQEADSLVSGIGPLPGAEMQMLTKVRTLIRDVGFTLACDTVIGAVGASTDGK